MAPADRGGEGDVLFAGRKSVVVFDMEWTSWKDFWKHDWDLPGKYPEIVQIGAVELAADDGFRETGSFQTLVRPAHNPMLSDYFIDLTGITQDAVDGEGISFSEALKAFVDFIGYDGTVTASWGGDEKIIGRNCRLYGIPFPGIFSGSEDVRPWVEAILGIDGKHIFSSDLPAVLGLPSEGTAHDALNDARSVGAALRHLREAGRL